MGGVGVEYVEALGVCVFRLTGTIHPEDVVAASLQEAMSHPTSTRLWDISEASFEGWTEPRLQGLIRSLAPTALTAPGMHVALVSASPEGAAIAQLVKHLIASKGYAMTVEVFSSRTAALEWLGVTHVPVGSAPPTVRP
jgi:hypothetical protein